MTTIRLAPGGEFDLIRRIVGQTDLSTDVMVGPGDDAAVLSDGWVLSTDLSVEDVHFRRSWITDEEVGYRAAAAALSDLAAMAADPVGLLVSCAAPRGGAVDVEAVQRGIRSAAQSVGACVVGGDMSRSPGPLSFARPADSKPAVVVLPDASQSEAESGQSRGLRIRLHFEVWVRSRRV